MVSDLYESKKCWCILCHSTFLQISWTLSFSLKDFFSGFILSFNALYEYEIYMSMFKISTTAQSIFASVQRVSPLLSGELIKQELYAHDVEVNVNVNVNINVREFVCAHLIIWSWSISTLRTEMLIIVIL